MRHLSADKHANSESLSFDSWSVSTIDLSEETVSPPTLNNGMANIELEATQVVQLLIPVVSNVMLTLICWLFVYDAQQAETSLPYLLDSRTNMTTSIDLLDGLFNGLTSTALITAISFAMLALALRDCRALVKAWLGFSYLLVLFGIFSIVLRDVLKAIDYKMDWMSMSVVVWNYGVVGVIVFFTNAPLDMYQLYVVSNCSLISLFYLRYFPAHTVWFVLLGLAGWDAFAVLAPVGPLRRISEKTQEYSDRVHNLLMFTTEPMPMPNKVEQFQQLHQSSNPSAASSSLGDDDQKKVGCSMDSEDEDDEEDEAEAVRLGLGDFVFYGVLVGKAASSGSWPATVAAAMGVLVGLCMTVMALPSYGRTLPALPTSIAFGMVLHWGTVLFVDPFLRIVVSRQLIW